MDNIIRITPCFQFNEYDSLSEAVAVAANSAEATQDKAALINRKVVVSYQFNGHTLVLSVADGWHLTVSLGATAINWDVVPIAPHILGDMTRQTLMFEFSDGELMHWDWQALLDNLVGKQIALAPSEPWLFILVRGGDEYMIDCYADEANPKRRFLVFTEA
jgi:hypothetical protein